MLVVLLATYCAVFFLVTQRARGPAHDTCREAGVLLEYFPDAGSWDQSRRFHGYASLLSNLGEPSFSCPTRVPIYRFLLVRSFQGPISVRVERRADAWRLVAVESLLMDGGASRARRVSRTLTRAEARRFEEALSRLSLFDAPARPWNRGLDGADWVVEARDSDRYRLHEEWSPEAGPVREFGEAVLALTGWRFQPHSIY